MSPEAIRRRYAALGVELPDGPPEIDPTAHCWGMHAWPLRAVIVRATRSAGGVFAVPLCEGCAEIGAGVDIPPGEWSGPVGFRPHGSGLDPEQLELGE